ncbi:MAG: hypothetical protein AB7O95_28700, partial [Geminicoccaceae bacterium]
GHTLLWEPRVHFALVETHRRPIEPETRSAKNVIGISDNYLAPRGRRRRELRVLDFPTPDYAKTAQDAQA